MLPEMFGELRLDSSNGLEYSRFQSGLTDKPEVVGGIIEPSL
ncbi:MAG: hypothetical protein ACKO6N_25740 [Myxococcota bacterium]